MKDDATRPTERDFTSIVWAGIGAFVVGYVVLDVFVLSKTPDEAKRISSTVTMCRWETVCAAYPKARDVCATAGSFEKCMEIKMGDDYDTARDVCANDGALNMPSSALPGWGACLIARLKYTQIDGR